MLIDDEKGIITIMKNYLELYGYEIITACSGQEALKKMSCMPDMDGFTVRQTIRSHITCQKAGTVRPAVLS